MLPCYILYTPQEFHYKVHQMMKKNKILMWPQIYNDNFGCFFKNVESYLGGPMYKTEQPPPDWQL